MVGLNRSYGPLWIDLPRCRQRDPGQAFLVRYRVGRFWKWGLREASTCDSNGIRRRGHKPEKRSSAVWAEVAFLVVVLRRVVKGIDPGFTLHLDNSGLVKVHRYAKRAARSALAVRAVAYAMHGR